MKQVIELYRNDCLDTLLFMEDNSVDSIVTDPPYGISFMNKKWDHQVPSIEVWKECLRVLKPGGHMLVACGTRTQHRMVTPIEDAGFEIRDVITWLYGSGFPKSLNISKAIDKEAGAEREVVGSKERPGGFNRGVLANSNFGREHQDDCGVITAPATEAAKQWDGFGTALKPACEFWTLCRKPIEEKTIAKNVLKFGTGGLNIDGCRVEAEDLEALQKNWNRVQSEHQGIASTGLKVIDLSDRAPNGRWPANLILDEEAAAALDEQSNANNSRFFYVAKASASEKTKGCEGLISWESLDQKQVEKTVLLSRQLRDIFASMTPVSGDREWNTSWYGKAITELFQKDIKSITSTELRQTIVLKTWNALVHLNIKENILDAIKMMETNGLNLAALVENTKELNKTSTNEETVSLMSASNALFNALLQIKEQGKQGNVHSTVKPVKLMEYLCKLITPPGGVVLDPFMGSGSTGVGAINEGFGFIGIERSEEYFEICKARLAFTETETA